MSSEKIEEAIDERVLGHKRMDLSYFLLATIKTPSTRNSPLADLFLAEPRSSLPHCHSHDEALTRQNEQVLPTRRGQ